MHAWIDVLVQQGALSLEAVERAERLSRETGTRLGAVLTRLGLLGERELADAFSAHYGLESLPPGPVHLASDLPSDLNLAFCHARCCMPVRGQGGVVRLAMADPGDSSVREALAFAVGGAMPVIVAQESEIDAAWRSHAEAAAAKPEDRGPVAGVAPGALEFQDDAALLADQASDAPVIRQAQRLVAKALALNASDIHIEPTPDAVRVRFRVDGLLGADETLPRHWSEPLVSRLKLMAKLDIAERRLPQDGRLRAAVQGQAVDLRVATFPSLNGESMVLRVLGRQDVALDLAAIGLSAQGLQALRAALTAPNGLVLITGPTGSGKTTTLYAALNALRRGSNKLVTVEDPVEYTLLGVTQLQIKPEIGLDFPAALRSVLRNDPDVIMVGEIRDRETADIAVRAALTGHLVLATLHTNSAAGAVTRLLDLGLPHYVLASTLVLTSAQRLVRRLCEHCRIPAPASDAELAVLQDAGLAAPDGPRPVLMQPSGCPRCLQRGYLGRTPLYEAIAADEHLRSLVVPGFDERTFVESARRLGAETLLMHGLQKALHGETSLEEVLSVTGRLDS
jgi:general secretion pathway protein E